MHDFISDKDLPELIDKTRHTDKESFKHILSLFSGMLHGILRSCGATADEYDDLYQEAQVGLYKAVMTYNREHSSFSTYAYICVQSSVLSFMRKTRSRGNIPTGLISSMSADLKGSVMSFITPETKLLDKESISLIVKKIGNSLSPFERKVLFLYLADKSYLEIAKELGKNKKSVDNAIQRIRKKLRYMPE
ncbi:MAG: sigma-70 family RNA polymerase sigma factor [Clostridia bacterium]|nr:sigma-70 family RNA polymerase sigma factor [Clostridia bacterium]